MATFLEYEKPLIVAMIQCLTKEECIAKIKRSIDDGAEALGIQLCKLERKYRNKEDLTEIFQACGGRPIYITSYRVGDSNGMTDDECVELLLLGLDCGATLCDIMGDYFDKGAPYQLTFKPEAVAKQKALADEIHKRGGEVLVSCHTGKCTTLAENLMLAKGELERGADVIKIVNFCESYDKIPEYMDSIRKINKLSDKKLLFLLSEKGQIMRYIGPSYGVCMYLTVQEHGVEDTKEQPLTRDIKAIRDAMNWEIMGSDF